MISQETYIEIIRAADEAVDAAIVKGNIKGDSFEGIAFLEVLRAMFAEELQHEALKK